MRRLIYGLGLLLAIQAGPAAGQTFIPREVVLKQLSTKYGEQVVARGLVANGWMLEILASENGETFTVIFTTPKMVSTVAAAGEAFHTIERQTDGVSH